MRRIWNSTIFFRVSTVSEIMSPYLSLVVVMRLKPDIEASSNYIDIYGALKCPTVLK